MSFVQVEIIGLSMSNANGGAYALILGENNGSRRLPIIIGGSEAQAIALELEGIQAPRPMTHDLLRDLCNLLGAEMTEVLIEDLRDGTFFAKIRLLNGGREFELDARPSDAIALAVRLQAPIYVADAVMEEASILPDDVDAPQESTIEASTPEDISAPKVEQESQRRRTQQPKSLKELKKDLDKAIADEDYERAAQIRDEIDKRTEGSN